MLLARMPSLSSFLPTVNPAKPALDEKRGDAAVAGLGVDVREDDEEVGFVAVGDPELAAGEHPRRRRAPVARVVSANASLPDPASDSA